MTTDATTAGSVRLGFRGGPVGAAVPFMLFLVGVAWLGLSGAPDERGFWPVLLAALGVGLALARDRGAYSDVVLRGMARPVVMVMILAWLLAGQLGAVLKATGLVEGLVWLSARLELSGVGFVAGAFGVCAAVSTATGTSLGTLILCVPLLLPAGVASGASPAVLMGAILGGATFGDNLSPVSDTTIASATTQGADVGGVVRSRLAYALPAAALAVVASLWIANGTPATAAAAASPADGAAVSLGMLVSPVLVLVALWRGAGLLEGLFLGVLSAVLAGFGLGLLEPAALLHVEEGSYLASGLLLEGMERGVGLSIFTLLLMGLVSVVEATGALEAVIARAEARLSTPRAAEAAIVAALSAAVVLTTHSVVAILSVGPFARRWGEGHGVSPYRRANLLDVTSCTFPFILPYCIPTVLAASLAASALGGLAPGPAVIGLHNTHAWALLAVVLVAVATGYGRRS